MEGVIRLGGLLALGPSDGFDGAEGSVEPGLLGGLDLVEGQTQVVLQVLNQQQREELKTAARATEQLTPKVFKERRPLFTSEASFQLFLQLCRQL